MPKLTVTIPTRSHAADALASPNPLFFTPGVAAPGSAMLLGSPSFDSLLRSLLDSPGLPMLSPSVFECWQPTASPRLPAPASAEFVADSSFVAPAASSYHHDVHSATDDTSSTGSASPAFDGTFSTSMPAPPGTTEEIGSSSSGGKITRVVETWAQEVLSLSPKELNKYIKHHNLSPAQADDLKKERRRALNRQYAVAARKRHNAKVKAVSKEHDVVSKSIAELQAEMMLLRQEKAAIEARERAIRDILAAQRDHA